MGKNRNWNSRAIVSLATLVAGGMCSAAQINWNNGNGNTIWGDRSNWDSRTVPQAGDSVFVNRDGRHKAVHKEGTAEMDRLHVGSVKGQPGEVEVSGGKFRVVKTTASRVGVSGGTGILTQSGGLAEFGQLLDIGRADSTGIYHLSGGTLKIFRSGDVDGRQVSLQLGNGGGTGTMNMTGGSAEFRGAVQLSGKGATFRLHGSTGTIKLGVGGSGFWYQASGSKLEVRMDAGGITPIVIAKGSDGGGHAVFEEGALLDVGFLEGAEREGSWDLIKWEGDYTDSGLAFAPGTDATRWSFEFVDTNDSERADTLRVIFKGK